MDNNGKNLDSAQKTPSSAALNHRQGWAELTAEYLLDLPDQFEQIRRRLEIRDYSTIKKHAHRIKGTAGTYHLDDIATAAKALEQFAEDRDRAGVERTLTAVIRMIKTSPAEQNPPDTSSAGGLAVDASSIDGLAEAADG